MYSKICSVVLMLAGLASSAHGAAVTYTNRAAFLAAAGGSLSFEGFGDLSLEPGVSLSTGGGAKYIIPNFAYCPVAGNSCLGLIESASATFTFTPGVSAVGFEYNELNAASLNIADSNGDVFNSALTTNSIGNNNYAPKFFGVISDVDLNWIRIGSGTDAAGSLYFLDNLRFGGTANAVPAPGTLSLVGLALAALAWRRRGHRA